MLITIKLKKVSRCEQPTHTKAINLWDDLSPKIKCNEYIIYRGQRDAKWDLTPSVFRNDVIPSKTHLCKCVRSFFMFEYFLLREFINGLNLSGLSIPNESSNLIKMFQCHFNFDNIFMGKNAMTWPNNDIIPLMALAQHYKIPTRLLDWSRRSYVAIYMAAKSALNEIHENGTDNFNLAIWKFRYSNNGDYDNISVIDVPKSSNVNLNAQRGCFTLVKDNEYKNDNGYICQKNLNDINITIHNRKAYTELTKLTIPASEARDLLKLCHNYDISGSTLFPDVYGAKEYAIEKFLIDQSN